MLFFAFYSISRYIFSFSFQIYRFSIHYHSSVREVICETSCFSFFSLSVPFLLIFPTFQTRQHISCFLSFYLILLSLFLLFYSFNVFPVQTCFPLPLHLSGLLFSFLRTILLFPHLSTFFILPLCFSRLFRRFSSPLPFFHPLFAIFQLFLHFFTSTYVTLPGSFFTFRAPQNVSRETSFFTIFGLQWSVRDDLLFLFPKITLVFVPSDF